MDLERKKRTRQRSLGNAYWSKGEDESEAVVEFRCQDLAVYLGCRLCHKRERRPATHRGQERRKDRMWLYDHDGRAGSRHTCLGRCLPETFSGNGIQTAKPKAQVNAGNRGRDAVR